jgi:iron(III) transport system ATP-binding protein
MMSDNVLKIEGLWHAYRHEEVLKNIYLDLNSGERTAILGESGSGKSTLLRCIAGFEKINRGKIMLGGRIVSDHIFNVPTEDRNLGMVLQERALFPHLTVKNNIMFGIDKVSSKNKIVADLAKLFKITSILDKFPSEISGGEQQRVAFARSLAPEPELLMLDEPFSALDQELKEELYAELIRIFDERNVAVLLVTHDLTEANILTSRQAKLDSGELTKT